MKYFFPFFLFFVFPFSTWAADDFVPADEENELMGTSSTGFIIDISNVGGDLKLQFGKSLDENLSWDDLNTQFSLSDDLDLQGNQLVNTRIENLSVAPTCDGLLEGRLYYDTVKKRTYTCDGARWVLSTQLSRVPGRSYLYTDNRWVTWSHALYGLNYYQWSSSAGTASDPVVSWTGVGMWFPKGTRITGITVTGRGNDTTVLEVEQSWSFRFPNVVTDWETGIDNNAENTSEEVYRGLWWNNVDVGQPTFSGAMNAIHQRHYSVDYVTPADGYLDQAFRHVGVLAATRYFYSSTSIEFILPS